MAKVIKSFFDLQDNNYEYKVGDIYPRKDYKPIKARIEELAGKKNKLGEALIEVEQPKEDAKLKKQTKKVEE
jgi:hypothetical protein